MGPWGTGKSSIKNLYTSGVANDLSRVDGTKRSEQIHVITFNAWRFGGENIKRALLRHVYRELRGQEDSLRDFLDRTVQQSRNQTRPWREIGADFLEKIALFACQIIMLAGGLILVYWLIPKVLPISGAWPTATLAVAVTILLGLVAKEALSNLSYWLVPLRHQVVTIEAPRTSAEEYEEMLIDRLEKFKLVYP